MCVCEGSCVRGAGVYPVHLCVCVPVGGCLKAGSGGQWGEDPVSVAVLM